MSNIEAVREANAAFYRAFESLNLTNMEAVWLRASYIKCVHPGWGLLVGWGPVMESWQRIFQNTLAMHFRLTDVRVEITGDLAWVTLVERLESEQRDGKSAAQVLATNLFERRDGQWYLVHHHASAVDLPQVSTSSEDMH